MSEIALDSTGRARWRPRSLPLVGLAFLGCAAVYAAGLTNGRAAGLISIAGGLLWLTAYVLLRREVQEAADLPDDRLDEREILLRDRSYLKAYRLLGGALAVSLLMGIVDDAVDSQLIKSWLSPLAALLLLSVVLPSIVLAVTEATQVVDGGGDD